MDPVRSSAARPRAADAIPLPVDGPAEPGSVELTRPLPVGSAILWTPTVDGAPSASPYPIFITQSAFAAVHAHVEAKPRGAASLGFLAGNRFTCPETGTAYVVIESAIQLPWSISGDHLGPALSQGWTVVQEEVRKNDGQLVGWYHTHHGVDPTPSPADIDRKSTRLNSSHSQISYAVFCLKKKNTITNIVSFCAGSTRRSNSISLFNYLFRPIVTYSSSI